SFSNPFDQLLVGSKQALAAARQKHIVSEAQLASLEHSPSPDSRTGLQADASEVARRDPDIASLESNLNFRRNELLAKLGGMLPTHPGRLEIEAELRQVDEVARVKREDLESTYASIILAQRQAEAAANARAERDIQKQVDEQAAQAIWYSHNYQRGINIRYEMDRSRRRLEAVEDRISFVEQEGRAPGFARLFSAARYPIEPLSGGRKKPILILFLLAAVLALAVPLGLDYLDPRVLSPDDVETVLGFAPMGVALASTADLAGNDHMRRLAAAIARDFERNASRSFVFVPVNGSARMSETVLGIGSELAGLGHTVEVVGAGIQQPLVQAAATGHGVGGSGNHSVPRSDSFGAMRSRMHDLAQRGAIVLVCAEPLSEDAETELLASSCDVVVLAIESVLTKKTELRAAIRRLEDIRPNAIAAVVTEYDPNPPLAELKLGTYICAAWLAGSRGQAAGGKNS
ncbi:MAG: hypothetical protein ABSG34_19240, partial [Candidatus Sulfotelmatobacter sp.]